MKKVAILNCQRALSVCTGASCFHAWHQKTGAFQRYLGEDVELAAFWYCNGCGVPLSDAGLQEKMERIKSMGVDTIHLGVCTKIKGEECPLITEMADDLAAAGIEIVRGTHPTHARVKKETDDQ